MNRDYYNQLADKSLDGEILSKDEARVVLSSSEVELPPLLNAAYEVRTKFVGKEVAVHIINNAQNGYCPEDCHYCAQGKSSNAQIEEYPMKSDSEFLAEARGAYEKGAHRYCMVFAGRGPTQQRVEHLARLIREIKSESPIEVCVSAGFIDESKAQILKSAGLDRLNHNLNTSATHYSKICTTHTYQQRLETLKNARAAGLQVCSGVILGMGEGIDDVLEMVYTLRDVGAESIPINFFMPIRGAKLENQASLSPEYCLRALCLFRFLNPKAEIRIAAGREMHLRSMEVMALYPANSLFLDGYLNAKGSDRLRTFQMIKDAGFTVKSEYSVEELIEKETPTERLRQLRQDDQILMKDLDDLRPQITK